MIQKHFGFIKKNIIHKIQKQEQNSDKNQLQSKSLPPPDTSNLGDKQFSDKFTSSVLNSKEKKQRGSTILSLPFSLTSLREIKEKLKHSFIKIKLKFAGKSKKKTQYQGRKRTLDTVSESHGRPFKYNIPPSFPERNIALIPSIINGIVRQGVRLPLKLGLADLRVWVRQSKVPLTIMLVIDSSASTYHFIEPISQILSTLYHDAYRNRDKLGLVAIQDNKAQIMNHPSRNLQIILGNITRLKPSGETPLSQALDLTLRIFKQEKRRHPIFNPLTILLSDCHPEPINSRTGNLMKELPYQQTLKTARAFGELKIPIVVINPGHGTFKDGSKWWGTQLAMRIAESSGGEYYGIPHDKYEKDAGFITKRLERSELETDSQSIANILFDFRDNLSTI